ncbi:hypothetical protein ECANGB1_2076 [Enterospora canceri]|uniref:Uncharacterized protein n=1 Tax=Enterospora canceri TaxID=1081671 RepID=A0A1Y1S8Q2_9MICR|nr:hypothetical protein ECANGB1_2076 [Enterospora canceri]
MIQCGEDADYSIVKAEYDSLTDYKTLRPSKKYLENLLIFPDVTWDNDEAKIETIYINNGDGSIQSKEIAFDDDYTMRDKIHSIIVDLVTNCNPNEKESKKNILKFYMSGKVTEDELRATIEELKEQAEISKAEGYFLDHLLYEETIKVTTKMVSDCKLKGEERLEKLKKHVQKLPCALTFTCRNNVNVTTAYVYFVFAIGDKRMKSEIIKVKRIDSEKQIIQDLEEYAVKIPKEITEIRKEESDAEVIDADESKADQLKADESDVNAEESNAQESGVDGSKADELNAQVIDVEELKAEKLKAKEARKERRKQRKKKENKRKQEKKKKESKRKQEKKKQRTKNQIRIPQSKSQ